MRFCIIASSGGSSFKEYLKISNLNHEILIITDRSCGIEKLKAKKGITHHRIKYSNKDFFSQQAKKKIDKFGEIKFILLFFTKIIGKSIFDSYPTFNIHSSILPSFPGLNSINQAFTKKVKVFGTTLHIVDSSIDNGKIIAQIFVPNNNYNLRQIKSISFLQNVLLVLILEEIVTFSDLNYYSHSIEAGISYSASPTLISNVYKESIYKLTKEKFFRNETENMRNNAAHLFALDRLFQNDRSG